MSVVAADGAIAGKSPNNRFPMIVWGFDRTYSALLPKQC